MPVSLLLFQVLLLNAAKDVAQSLNDLISATKAAAGKPVNDPTMDTLKTSAKVRCSCEMYLYLIVVCGGEGLCTTGIL